MYSYSEMNLLTPIKNKCDILIYIYFFNVKLY